MSLEKNGLDLLISMDEIIAQLLNDPTEKPIDEVIDNIYECLNEIHVVTDDFSLEVGLEEYLLKHLSKDQIFSEKQLNNLLDIAIRLNSSETLDFLIEYNNGKIDFSLLKELASNPAGPASCCNLEHIVVNYKLNDATLYYILKLLIDNYTYTSDTKDLFRYTLSKCENSDRLQEFLDLLLCRTLVSDAAKSLTPILLEYGADPFGIYKNKNSGTSTPILFLVANKRTDGLRELADYDALPEEWNILDSWGRNLLHFCTGDRNTYQILLKLGVNPDHRALIDDQKKVVAAKLNGTLPEEYGKTPKEIFLAKNKGMRNS